MKIVRKNSLFRDLKMNYQKQSTHRTGAFCIGILAIPCMKKKYSHDNFQEYNYEVERANYVHNQLTTNLVCGF